MRLKMYLRDREPVGPALRRFRKMMERSGLQKELRERKHYTKPSELRRLKAARKRSLLAKIARRPARPPGWLAR